MKTTWVVIAHRAGVRIVEEMRPGTFELVREIHHPEGRWHDGDIDSDRPGMAFDGRRGGRHVMRQGESATEHRTVVFAHEIADLLNAERLAGSYDNLSLVAEPHFLGTLSTALDKQTAQRVSRTLHKDLAHVPMRDLAKQLERSRA